MNDKKQTYLPTRARQRIIISHRQWRASDASATRILFPLPFPSSPLHSSSFLRAIIIFVRVLRHESCERGRVFVFSPPIPLGSRRFRGAAAAPLFNPPPLLDGMERRTVITDICNSPEGGNGSRVILGIFTEKLVLFLFSEILRKEGR